MHKLFSAVLLFTGCSVAQIVSQPSSGGGGGGGTPCVTTALSLQFNNAGAFGCLAEFTYGSSTITASAAGVVDLHAAGSSGLFVPGAYTTGVLHNVTSTGALTGGLIVNADITNATIDLTTKVTGVLPTANIAVALANQTSIHGLAITASTGTLAIANAKTATISNTLTFTGTDSSSVAFGAGGTVLYNGGALGTPTSGSAANLTGLPVSTGISGLGTGVATFLATPSGANFNSMIAAGGVPIAQNSKSAAYTTVLADGGGQIYHPSADTTARTWTIDSNANVAYAIGTTLTFVNDTSAGTLTIAITSDTLVLAGAGTTGSRTLAAGGIATAIKVTSTRWIINGTGLT